MYPSNSAILAVKVVKCVVIIGKCNDFFLIFISVSGTTYILIMTVSLEEYFRTTFEDKLLV